MKTKFRIGFHRHGKCWRFRFTRTRYYSGAMTWFSFWRLYLVVDRRLAVIGGEG